MNLIQAADVSTWSGHIGYQQWAQVRRRVQLAIVGSWHGRESNQTAANTLTSAQSAGLSVATYAVINSLDGERSIERAKQACGRSWPALKFVALDIEVDGVSEATIQAAADEVRNEGLRPIIYTGRWFWSGHLGNPTWAADLPLWDSAYNGQSDLTFDGYGAWKTVVGHQYQGTNSALGFSADLSVFDADWVHGRK